MHTVVIIRCGRWLASSYFVCLMAVNLPRLSLHICRLCCKLLHIIIPRS